jgi:hypothetical protein
MSDPGHTPGLSNRLTTEAGMSHFDAFDRARFDRMFHPTHIGDPPNLEMSQLENVAQGMQNYIPLNSFFTENPGRAYVIALGADWEFEADDYGNPKVGPSGDGGYVILRRKSDHSTVCHVAFPKEGFGQVQIHDERGTSWEVKSSGGEVTISAYEQSTGNPRYMREGQWFDQNWPSWCAANTIGASLVSISGSSQLADSFTAHGTDGLIVNQPTPERDSMTISGVAGTSTYTSMDEFFNSYPTPVLDLNVAAGLVVSVGPVWRYDSGILASNGGPHHGGYVRIFDPVSQHVQYLAFPDGAWSRMRLHQTLPAGGTRDGSITYVKEGGENVVVNWSDGTSPSTNNVNIDKNNESLVVDGRNVYAYPSSNLIITKKPRPVPSNAAASSSAHVH